MKKSILLIAAIAVIECVSLKGFPQFGGMYFFNRTNKDVIITPCVNANWKPWESVDPKDPSAARKMSIEKADIPRACKSSRQKTLPAFQNNKNMVATGYQGPNGYVIKIGNKEWWLAQHANHDLWYVRNKNGKEWKLGTIGLPEENKVIWITYRDKTAEHPFELSDLSHQQKVNPSIQWPDKLILHEDRTDEYGPQ